MKKEIRYVSKTIRMQKGQKRLESSKLFGARKSGKSWLYGASILALFAGGTVAAQASTTTTAEQIVPSASEAPQTSNAASNTASSSVISDTATNLPNSQAVLSSAAASSAVSSAASQSQSSMSLSSDSSLSSSTANPVTKSVPRAALASISISSSASNPIVSSVAASTSALSGSSLSSTSSLTPKSMTQAAIPTVAPAAIDVYRLYLGQTNEHFYTTNLNEANTLKNSGWNFEGIAWEALKQSNQPVYRLYNSSSRLHLFTIDNNEKNVLSTRGWNYEGIAFYSGGTIATYRAYYPDGNHNYTTSAYEEKVITTQRGWSNEGVAWQVYAPGVQASLATGIGVDSNARTISTTVTESSVYGTHTLSNISHYTISATYANYTGKETIQVTGLPSFISDLQLPTWHNANQSDISWYSAHVNGGTVNFTFQAEARGISGNFITDIYASINGKETGLGRVNYTDSWIPNVNSGNSIIESAIANGLSLVGKSPYAWGGGRTGADIAANKFDCSSFVSWMYHSAGHTIDNQATTTTYSLINKGTGVSWNNIQRGDLILMDAQGDQHVVIYMGDGYFLHDSPGSATGGVGVNNFNDWHSDFGMTWGSLLTRDLIGVRRVV
ncbi:MAG: C40 family peptidase [Streptococcaceae bacterium]|jgi:cell wall-associated NlpC family hydrolase|nr:C40 family peptidase [Streptococcaceae bacterium]